MQNNYLDNKIVIKYCKDYYRIINGDLILDKETSFDLIL